MSRLNWIFVTDTLWIMQGKTLLHCARVFQRARAIGKMPNNICGYLRASAALFFSALSVAVLSAQSVAPGSEREFLSRVRRLTVEGKRAGEGYWSPDGKRLVFQSEREPANPFYQIYVLDFDTGETKRISPGIGKTTCAFFRAGTRSDSVCLDTSRSQLQETAG